MADTMEDRVNAKMRALADALRECAKDSFTAADGMSQSGKRTPAGERYHKAQEAIILAESFSNDPREQAEEFARLLTEGRH